MASLRIIPGANHSIFHINKSPQITHSNSSLFLSNPSKKRIPQGIFASMALPSTTTPMYKPSLHEESSIDQEKDSIFSSKIDQWMEESAQDIVKNLKQAPLLVHIHDGDGDGDGDGNGNGNGNGKAKFKTEKAVLENWPIVKSEWESGESKSPDGLIFVEEIDEAADSLNGDGDFEEGVTRAWGIVVQGKGVECGPACYLLKTSRVGAGLGLGVCCTHFCLVRVQSFSQSAFTQFNDSWLLR